MYYVYEWYIVETNEIIYVGKGVHNRYKVRKHNKFFNDMIRRYNCDSRIVKEFDTEKEAFEYEYERINELKEIKQCVCNIYKGGFGGSTEWWNDELREKYSSQNVMKSELQRKRMKQNNPMKNKDIAIKTNGKKKRPVIIGNVEYDSVKSAMQKYGVNQSAIAEWCARGKNPYDEVCYYKDSGLSDNIEYVNDGQKKPLIYDGFIYPSTACLAVMQGISQTTASRWCRQGRDSKGKECRYISDKREIIHSPNIKSQSIIVNGKHYSSKSEASKELGINTYTLTQYLNGNKKDNKYICEYDNQHPSRVKSDNSNTEGSTTNR